MTVKDLMQILKNRNKNLEIQVLYKETCIDYDEDFEPIEEEVNIISNLDNAVFKGYENKFYIIL